MFFQSINLSKYGNKVLALLMTQDNQKDYKKHKHNFNKYKERAAKRMNIFNNIRINLCDVILEKKILTHQDVKKYVTNTYLTYILFELNDNFANF